MKIIDKFSKAVKKYNSNLENVTLLKHTKEPKKEPLMMQNGRWHFMAAVLHAS